MPNKVNGTPNNVNILGYSASRTITFSQVILYEGTPV